MSFGPGPLWMQVPGPRRHEDVSELLRRTFGDYAAWGTVLSFGHTQRSEGPGLLHFFPVDNSAAPGADPAVGHLRAALATALGAAAHPVAS